MNTVDSNEIHVQRLGRQELCDLVWATPMSVLAQQFGISATGLGKICRKHRIPKPPADYWGKLTRGIDSAQPPLPSLPESTAESVIIMEPNSPNPDHPPPNPGAGLLDQDVARLLDKIRNIEPVLSDSAKRHKLVTNTARALASHDRQTDVFRRRRCGRPRIDGIKQNNYVVLSTRRKGHMVFTTSSGNLATQIGANGQERLQTKSIL